jgi:predicted flap endonuclease-1-like 5' DNA nuclease
LGVSIFSYNGEVTLGVAVDEGLVPDPDNIIEAFHVEFDSMMELVRHAALDSAETAPAPPPPVALATAAAPTAVVAVEPDDLTRIKGIGPKTAAALNEKEVTTFAQLSTMTPDAIRALLDESTVRLLRNIDSWPTQAAALDVIKTAQALP